LPPVPNAMRESNLLLISVELLVFDNFYIPRAMATMERLTTIDQSEDSEYISDVNKRLEVRYNCPPNINPTP